MFVCVCVCVSVCVFVCVSVLVSVVLQALVEVDGGGLGADFSYPLLQIWLQAAHTHGAMRTVIDEVHQNEPSIPVSP